MTSEIRVNKIENRSGLGTVTFADTGVDLAGIVTATTFSGSGASLTALPAAQLSGTLPAISGANLTNLAAANLTGTLPAISAANLTSIPAANVTGTLPALTAANLTNIPAANLVGVCTSGLTKTGGFGSLVQVVTAQKLNTTSTTSTTMVEVSSDLRCTITPTSASNKLIILCSLYLTMSATSHISSVEVRKDGSLLNAPTNYNTGTHDGHTMNYTNNNWMGNNVIQTIDTAGDTNSRTYSPYYKGTGADVYLNGWGTSDYRGISSMTVMEIVA